MRRSFLHALSSAVAVAIVATALVFVPAATGTDSSEAVTKRAAQRIMTVARSKRGAPYQWGGSGPSRFDCSGYTQWVFARAGKRIPRTSRQQAAFTRRIARSQRRVGDLVFFHSGGRVYHVGIYAGKNMMWNSPRPGRSVGKDRIWTSSVFYGRVR